MDSVPFPKFWRTAAPSTAIISGADQQKQEHQEDEEQEEEEDSFFDLELLSVSAAETQSRPQIPAKLGDHINLCSRDLQTDFISKRKILPIEPVAAAPKPQSPIQLLKSAPKLPLPDFIFKKQRSTAKNRAPAGEDPQQERTTNLAGETSARRIGGGFPADPCPAPARRFSKETVQKYLKLIKPRNLKKPTDSGDPPAAAESPMRERQENGFPAGIRQVCKHLGKSKSASSSAAVGGGLAAAGRRDDSLLQQHDGIQSAILHCKRSLNSSSTEHHNPLSASQERSRSLSCKDFSLKESKEVGI